MLKHFLLESLGCAMVALSAIMIVGPTCGPHSWAFRISMAIYTGVMP